MQKTLGGDRLGSGSKIKVNLHGYERSTHDLSYLWRSTMAPGTLVPFMSEVALPGDTFDINLRCEIMTHPTIGPLFGTYKIQLDVFQAPIRLYHSQLHNNALGIGLNMSQVKLPQYTLPAEPLIPNTTTDIDNMQVNPSCILNYLGIRGAGLNKSGILQTRNFNAIPILAYWEIYKNYYANKQEEIGAVLHSPNNPASTGTITGITTVTDENVVSTLPLYPATQNIIANDNADLIKIAFTGQQPNTAQIIINTNERGDLTANEIFRYFTVGPAGILQGQYNQTMWGQLTLRNYRPKDAGDTRPGKPNIVTFPLTDIDKMRMEVLSHQTPGVPFNIVDTAVPLYPYYYLSGITGVSRHVLSGQEGLGLKTYQSDLFNNWLQTEWIDGTTGINTITAIDTSSGSFTLDTLNLSKKVYDMLNRIAVSGGSYDDWLDAVYAHDRYTRCESPMYMGGLIRELAFQEVVSNAQSTEQPLGTLAGKGIMTDKKKGGHIVIKIDEPSYIIGIISLTPRIDYSQGNKWDMSLQTLDDLHKPGLDEIGFQELITEQMAWWDTQWDTTSSTWLKKSAGKQPAWINYMTNVNQTKGNFAIAGNEMFMTLNRRYSWDSVLGIKDLTTYIDPSKFNNIFAETSLDAQNFWAQISVNITSRRKMSAKVMPNV